MLHVAIAKQIFSPAGSLEDVSWKGRCEWPTCLMLLAFEGRLTFHALASSQLRTKTQFSCLMLTNRTMIQNVRSKSASIELVDR